MDLEQGLRTARPGVVAAVLALIATATACVDPPLPTQVEAAGEPGAPTFRASGPFEWLGYPVVGRATYVIDAAGLAALSLSPEFSIPDVPRVSIFLSNSGDLRGAVKVGGLRTSAGPMRWTFRAPPGAAWSWALLWTEELRIGVGRAYLRQQ